MEERDMTILEAARALGYTKNAVKYQVAKLTDKEAYKDSSGIIRIKPAGLKALEARMGKKELDNNRQTTTKTTRQQLDNNQERTGQQPANNQAATTKENEENQGEERQLYEALLRTVDTLQEQLRVKDEQIASLTRLLDQQQHLQAAQIQALKAPETDEPEPAEQQPQETKDEPRNEQRQRGIFGLFRRHNS